MRRLPDFVPEDFERTLKRYDKALLKLPKSSRVGIGTNSKNNVTYHLIYQNDGILESQYFDKLEELEIYTSKHVDKYIIVKMEIIKKRL